MGYDHAVGKELEHSTPDSSNRSDQSREDEILKLEKDNSWHNERRDTVRTVDDGGDFDPSKLKLKHGHSHTHTLGMLKLRANDDEDPSDWWFASTAIPLITATFAPMANLLSIAALVVPWRADLRPDSYFADGTHGTLPGAAPDAAVGFSDPHWCIALNIASLVCGFVGNLFLLFNFTKRVRYIVALPATIILFYFASGILIGITSSMQIYVPPKDGQIYSQGYWHAIIAATLYMFNSMILMVNMWGYFLGHYPQHFTLTDEQRNLILQTMMFFMWLGAGAAVFSKVQGWDYPDALYFCDVTILTIGFGDFFATSNLGRGLVFPYSVGGTIILGLMVSSISRFAGELSKDKVFRQHVESSRVNTLSRAVTMTTEEKRRDELEKTIDTRPGHRPTISAPLPSPPPKNLADRQIAFDEPEKPPAKEQKVVENESEPAPSQFMTHKSHQGTLHRTMQMMIKPVNQLRKITTKQQKAIIMAEEKDRFDAMRNIQIGARQFKKWYALAISVCAFVILWCGGAIVFWQCEKHTQGLTYFQALYFCYVSLLTIGYGDLSPRSNAGKPFFIVWSLIAVPTMTILISDMGDTVISSFKRGTFKLADFTVLPRAGLYKDFMQANPWLWRLLQRRAEKKRIAKGLPVGPAPPNPEDGYPGPTIEQLANERLTDNQLTMRLAFAIRRTADDIKHRDHKRYTYEEWVEYTRLIRFTRSDASQMEYNEADDGIIEWDWLDENSPMLSEQSEAEWVMDRLCESLLRLLRKNRLGLAEDDDGQEQGKNGFMKGFSFNSRAQPGEDLDSVDPFTGQNMGSSTAVETDAGVSKTQERRERATGADAMLTFFTGERKGKNAYANTDPVWSKKAGDRRRRSSVGVKRTGPFGHLVHSGPKGTVGGGRGGAGVRTLKQRQVSMGIL